MTLAGEAGVLGDLANLLAREPADPAYRRADQRAEPREGQDDRGLAWVEQASGQRRCRDRDRSRLGMVLHAFSAFCGVDSLPSRMWLAVGLARPPVAWCFCRVLWALLSVLVAGRRGSASARTGGGGRWGWGSCVRRGVP